MDQKVVVESIENHLIVRHQNGKQTVTRRLDYNFTVNESIAEDPVLMTIGVLQPPLRILNREVTGCSRTLVASHHPQKTITEVSSSLPHITLRPVVRTETNYLPKEEYTSTQHSPDLVPNLKPKVPISKTPQKYQPLSPGPNTCTAMNHTQTSKSNVIPSTAPVKGHTSQNQFDLSQDVKQQSQNLTENRQGVLKNRCIKILRKNLTSLDEAAAVDSRKKGPTVLNYVKEDVLEKEIETLDSLDDQSLRVLVVKVMDVLNDMYGDFIAEELEKYLGPEKYNQIASETTTEFSEFLARRHFEKNKENLVPVESKNVALANGQSPCNSSGSQQPIDLLTGSPVFVTLDSKSLEGKTIFIRNGLGRENIKSSSFDAKNAMDNANATNPDSHEADDILVHQKVQSNGSNSKLNGSDRASVQDEIVAADMIISHKIAKLHLKQPPLTDEENFTFENDLSPSKNFKTKNLVLPDQIFESPDNLKSNNIKKILGETHKIIKLDNATKSTAQKSILKRSWSNKNPENSNSPSLANDAKTSSSENSNLKVTNTVTIENPKQIGCSTPRSSTTKSLHSDDSLKSEPLLSSSNNTVQTSDSVEPQDFICFNARKAEAKTYNKLNRTCPVVPTVNNNVANPKTAPILTINVQLNSRTSVDQTPNKVMKNKGSLNILSFATPQGKMQNTANSDTSQPKILSHRKVEILSSEKSGSKIQSHDHIIFLETAQNSQNEASFHDEVIPKSSSSQSIKFDPNIIKNFTEIVCKPVSKEIDKHIQEKKYVVKQQDEHLYCLKNKKKDDVDDSVLLNPEDKVYMMETGNNCQEISISNENVIKNLSKNTNIQLEILKNGAKNAIVGSNTAPSLSTLKDSDCILIETGETFRNISNNEGTQVKNNDCSKNINFEPKEASTQSNSSKSNTSSFCSPSKDGACNLVEKASKHHDVSSKANNQVAKNCQKNINMESQTPEIYSKNGNRSSNDTDCILIETGEHFLNISSNKEKLVKNIDCSKNLSFKKIPSNNASNESSLLSISEDATCNLVKTCTVLQQISSKDKNKVAKSINMESPEIRSKNGNRSPKDTDCILIETGERFLNISSIKENLVTNIDCSKNLSFKKIASNNALKSNESSLLSISEDAACNLVKTCTILQEISSKDKNKVAKSINMESQSFEIHSKNGNRSPEDTDCLLIETGEHCLNISSNKENLVKNIDCSKNLSFKKITSNNKENLDKKIDCSKNVNFKKLASNNVSKSNKSSRLSISEDAACNLVKTCNEQEIYSKDKNEAAKNCQKNINVKQKTPSIHLKNGNTSPEDTDCILIKTSQNLSLSKDRQTRNLTPSTSEINVLKNSRRVGKVLHQNQRNFFRKHIFSISKSIAHRIKAVKKTYTDLNMLVRIINLNRMDADLDTSLLRTKLLNLHTIFDLVDETYITLKHRDVRKLKAAFGKVCVAKEQKGVLKGRVLRRKRGVVLRKLNDKSPPQVVWKNDRVVRETTKKNTAGKYEEQVSMKPLKTYSKVHRNGIKTDSESTKSNDSIEDLEKSCKKERGDMHISAVSLKVRDNIENKVEFEEINNSCKEEKNDMEIREVGLNVHDIIENKMKLEEIVNTSCKEEKKEVGLNVHDIVENEMKLEEINKNCKKKKDEMQDHDLNIRHNLHNKNLNVEDQVISNKGKKDKNEGGILQCIIHYDKRKVTKDIKQEMIECFSEFSIPNILSKRNENKVNDTYKAEGGSRHSSLKVVPVKEEFPLTKKKDTCNSLSRGKKRRGRASSDSDNLIIPKKILRSSDVNKKTRTTRERGSMYTQNEARLKSLRSRSSSNNTK